MNRHRFNESPQRAATKVGAAFPERRYHVERKIAQSLASGILSLVSTSSNT
jgi:hypothetical protein